MGRVFLLHPRSSAQTTVLDNTYQVNNKFCSDRNKFNLECYYEPLSSCTLEDALGTNETIDHLKSRKVDQYTYISDSDLVYKEYWKRNISHKTIVIENRGDSHYNPYIFSAFRKCCVTSGRDDWWLSIFSAYFIRPNKLTLDLMDTYRNASSLRHLDRHGKCVGIYIRHGDKGVEMPLVKTSNYLTIAKFLLDNGMTSLNNQGKYAMSLHSHEISVLLEQFYSMNRSVHNSTAHTVFVGSEDPEAIEDAIRWGTAENVHVLYTNIFDRRTDVSTSLGWDEQVALKKAHMNKHHPLEYFSMLLNLDYLLRCNVYVCALGSNFCRVLDELRVTVANKANAHYVDPRVYSNNKTNGYLY